MSSGADSIRRAYEAAFAAAVGAPAARAFGMGRQGLVVLLRALGVGQGEPVGVCGYTCLSVAEAVKVAGGQPVYLDVDDQLCIDPAGLARLRPGELKVLILQHTFGLPGQLDGLLAEARRLGAAVVEDCCHALGTRFRGQPMGTFGAGAIYSFQWGKSYSTGQGGMLTVQDAGLAGRVDAEIAQLARPMPRRADWLLAGERLAAGAMAAVHMQGAAKWMYHRLIRAGLAAGSFAQQLDFTLRPGYVRLAGRRMSAAGRRRLARWPALADFRRSNPALIAASLTRAGLPVWDPGPDVQPVMLRYPIRVARKSAVLARAQRLGVDLAGWYDSPIHPLGGEQLEQVGYRAGSCPRAEELISQIVHLPVGPTFSPDMAEAVMGIMR